MKRLLALVACFSIACTSASAGSRRSLEWPSPADIGGGGSIDDVMLRHALAPTGFWGGDYTTPTNEHVAVYSSPEYAVDEAANQRWANFVASLVHGSELSAVTIYLAPPEQVSDLCGSGDALGCWERDAIVAPGEDTTEISAESVLTHEYGHEIAAHRSNAPWRALDWGTKRWASYIQVCRRAAKHELFPGSEQPLLYTFNPGEAFAESYRLLNEERAGLPITPWRVVDTSLEPDARALALLEQDVVQPWTANSTVTFTGSFGQSGWPVRTYSVATPYDGTFRASAVASPGERLRVRAPEKVCGARTTTVRITRLAGSGRFTLAISRP